MSACTFFGHRDCNDDIESEVYACVENLIRNNVAVFYVGTQGNFDAMVHRVLKKLKVKYPHIKCNIVFAYLPDKKEVSESDSVYPEGIENVPPRFAIDYRNKWMINNSEYVVCCVKYNFGGAYKFLKFAEKQKKSVINLFNELNKNPTENFCKF